MSWVTAVGGGLRLQIHVQPRAATTEVVGLHGDALKIRLAAPPVDGAANLALLRFLADRLDMPRTALTLVSGMSGRRKVIMLEGVTEDTARRRLSPRPD